MSLIARAVCSGAKINRPRLVDANANHAAAKLGSRVTASRYNSAERTIA